MYGYVYLTTNLINGHKYIGQHKSESFDESYKGSGTLVRRAYDKHGWENFKTEVLEWCQSREELNEREKYWISYYDAVNSPDFYNIAPGGEGVSSEMVSGEKNPRYGIVLSNELKKKIGDSLRGEKNLGYMKARPIDERLKISESHKGMRPSKETLEKMSKNRSNHGKVGVPVRVIQYSRDMTEIARFNSVSEAAKLTGTNMRCISNVCRGYHYSANGFIWRYEKDVDS